MKWKTPAWIEAIEEWFDAKQDKFYEWIEEKGDEWFDKLMETPKANRIWRERDGVEYTELLMDKLCYMEKYHPVAFQWMKTLATIALEIVVSAITCVITVWIAMN